jgi:hypothetical protein
MFKPCREKLVVFGIAMMTFLCGVIFSEPTREFLSSLRIPDVTISTSSSSSSSSSSSDPAQAQSGAPAEQSVESQFSTTFPGTATNFYYARVGDDIYWIRFDIPPSNLGGLFSRSPYMTCNFPLTEGYMPNFDAPPLSTSGTALAWWNPNSATSIVGGECSSGGRTFMIMANTANPNLWTIYMQVEQV